jgi:alkyl sulfatase BDS1-like metallo-beta-lactamase superfamily hydrolase
VGAGLGQVTSTGRVSLIAPTVDISTDGEEMVIDGVRVVFQLAPGSEAPAEMHFHFPERRALCMAENATHTMHNILTLRGALVRDPHAWAGYLTQAIELFADQTDVVFASHHWPTWGAEQVVEFLGQQRDMYAYLHDQTLRLLNRGLTGIEAAEDFPMPPKLNAAWNTHGYYGSVSHNVKAIYQRYLGWYDGNPARLWQYPPESAARRFVECVGGADAAVAKARSYFEDKDFRWAAQMLDQVVFAQPDHIEAKSLLADTLEQLGFSAENGTWRNAYLSGAMELREGNAGIPSATIATDLFAQLTAEMFFDAIAVKVDGPLAWDLDLSLGWTFPELGSYYRTTLRNGVFTHVRDGKGTTALQLTVPRAAMAGLATGSVAAAVAGGLKLDGDESALGQLLGVLERGDLRFNIVEP